MLASCSMNELPVDSIDDKDAIQNLQDAAKFRNGIYVNIRNITSGKFIYCSEIQADMFIGTLINGNNLGVISLGSINSSDSDFEEIWAYSYAFIGATNYFLPNLEKLLSDETLDENSRLTLIRYRGETKWARAYYYYYLMDHYCGSYTIVDPQAKASGLPLVTEYNPSDDYSSYPGRSTLAETMALIEKDLEDAYTDLAAFEKDGGTSAGEALRANSPYLSTNTVLALQARVALLKGDYENAKNKANTVIRSGKYRLDELDDYMYIWTDDEGRELIFVPYGNQAQSSGIPSTGSAWIEPSLDKADYVAGSNALDMYDTFDDIRYESFFEPRSLTVNGASVVSPCFVKYPGNPVLNTTSENALKNLPKPFRLSEMYLIVAEAAAETNNVDEANSALNTIRRARIYDYQAKNYTGSALVDEIRKERTKELIGEGFRISDLRRWQLGFKRQADYGNYSQYDETAGILIPSGASLSYPAGDYRLVLPIPTGEMEANPQLAGQQNPGY